VKKWCLGEIQGKIKQSVCILKHFGAKKFAFVLSFLQTIDNQFVRNVFYRSCTKSDNPLLKFIIKLKVFT